jgi:SAM-dependent MidA family methyltransferase
MEPSKAVKEYKAELIKAQNKRLTTLVGKVMVEKEWLAKKSSSAWAYLIVNNELTSSLPRCIPHLLCRLINSVNY